jgi:hypothetical protein
MRRENKRHHQHRSGSEQFDLFRLSCGDCATQKPVWKALPPQTRETLTNLMTRLLLDHARDRRHPETRETRHGEDSATSP